MDRNKVPTTDMEKQNMHCTVCTRKQVLSSAAVQLEKNSTHYIERFEVWTHV
jgi:hypothetical protein